MVEQLGMQRRRDDGEQSPVVAHLVVPRHVEGQMVLEMNADVQRHQQPPDRKERGTGAQERILLPSDIAAVLKGPFHLIERPQDLKSEQGGDHRFPGAETVGETGERQPTPESRQHQPVAGLVLAARIPDQHESGDQQHFEDDSHEVTSGQEVMHLGIVRSEGPSVMDRVTLRPVALVVDAEGNRDRPAERPVPGAGCLLVAG
ncbi:MAG: hypothetical protein H7338_11315 [Candidatus Sericytochromatia bacterium]|nr:hypothetical protein [Candidatus Sericytochromatia bacterium]